MFKTPSDHSSWVSGSPSVKILMGMQIWNRDLLRASESVDCVRVSGLWLKRLCLCQVFREQAIDGDTLPLLTEEHLLNTMGLKLGPALKIRSQVHTSQTCVCWNGAFKCLSVWEYLLAQRSVANSPKLACPCKLLPRLLSLK